MLQLVIMYALSGAFNAEGWACSPAVSFALYKAYNRAMYSSVNASPMMTGSVLGNRPSSSFGGPGWKLKENLAK